MRALLLRGWDWSEMVLLQGILLVGILGVGFIVSPFINHERADHPHGQLMLKWRDATPEEELAWQLRHDQGMNRWSSDPARR